MITWAGDIIFGMISLVNVSFMIRLARLDPTNVVPELKIPTLLSFSTKSKDMVNSVDDGFVTIFLNRLSQIMVFVCTAMFDRLSIDIYPDHTHF